ncbi:MAG: insulinase family protein [Chlamydiae bacterium]|nr:insulinase family protein [Chlamydiota bacterium]
MKYKIGTIYKSFKVTKYLKIEEIQVELLELTHLPTNAKVIQIANNDDENLFALSFQTLPSSSNGAAHILEHTALCGSKKFPVKDPFFSMLRRSLHTFMNAFTGHDFTSYPAASQIEKDFYNLLSVYLDAVFHPNLNELSFLQEGHRLEFLNPSDPKSPLTFKGIVYNEMKGSLASAENRLSHKMLELLTPDLPYAFNSGGDPKDIVKLSYQDLLNFHEKFYHPSRCLFFFYGNIPLEKNLDFISENALQGVKKQKPLPPIKKQKRFLAPKSFIAYYPLTNQENLENKCFISFGYLTTNVKNQEELLALTLLDNVLMGTDAAPLKKEILKSGLCKDVESSLDLEMSEIPYIFTCKDASLKNKDLLFNLIQTTLKKIVKDKIPHHLIEASLHQIEFSRTEIASDGYPYGLILFFRSALAEQHGCKPENSMLIHSLFNSLRKKLKNPNYLSNLINKYLLKNKHLVKLTFIPDTALEKKENDEEQERLAKIKKSLSQKQTEKILQTTLSLKKYQESLEHASLDCLPKLQLSDVPQKIKDYPLKEEKFNNLTVFQHNCFTNDIIYADLLFDLPYIAQEELSFLSLFSLILTEVGSGNRNYQSNLEFIQAHTGGIHSYISLNVQVDNPNDLKPSFAIRSKALKRNVQELFQLLKETADSPIFDDPARIKELLLQHYTSLENNLNKNAMRYAANLSLSSLNIPSFIGSRLSGLDYYLFFKSFIQDLDVKLPSIIASLNTLKQRVLCQENCHLVLGCDDELYKYIKKHNFFALSELKLKKSSALWKSDYKIDPTESQARIISSPVAFNSVACKAIGYTHEDAPALLIAANLFDNVVLHKKIREEGGAYGSSANYTPISATFNFSSYRDPHISSTINAFDLAIKTILEGIFTSSDLEEAKLEVIQHLDAPLSFATRAITAYSWKRTKITTALREKFRQKILLASREDIIKAALFISDKIKNNIHITFAGKELLEKEKSLLKNLKIFKI